MANTLSCELCGKGNLNPSTLKIHEKSKSHQAKVDAQVAVVEEEPEPEWPEPIMAVLTDFFEHRIDPVECARDMRKVFQHNRWPNRAQPSSVRQILERAGVPIFDVPKTSEMTEGKSRRIRLEQLKQFHGEIY